VTEATAAIEVSALCVDWGAACPAVEELARTAARLALNRGMTGWQTPLPRRIELGVTLADDATQRRLNRDWRGIDRTTNVLAFPAWDPEPRRPPEVPVLLGDVVLAFETVAREAENQGKPFADHLAHLIVHGVLHLLGHDHRTEAEAAAMESLEADILANLGVPDPYRGTMSAVGPKPISR
jgi:probable rRNA maturation factor